MNILDKAIASVAPERALKRYAARRTLQILNSGYGDGGASHSKKSMRGFTAKSLSPTLNVTSFSSSISIIPSVVIWGVPSVSYTGLPSASRTGTLFSESVNL